MKLIDNRYKVNRVLEDNLYNSNFEVIDLWDEDKILYMKLYNIDRQNSIIEYFINNFILLSKIKHENLLTSNRFNIINTIDGKKASIKQYYSITEYIDSPSLDKVYEKLNFKQRLNIILQLCSVLDFLHYRGVVYKHLSPSNIFLLENGNIKIMDLATIYERQMNTDYDDLTRYFIAPEVMLENEEMVNKNADEYSLGMLMIYLLTEDFYGNYSRKFNYTSELELDFKQIEFLDRTIIDLTKKNPLIREGRLREIINRINSLFNMGFEYNLVKERGSLNFDTKIIGREKQLEKILKISDKSINSRLYKKAILIKGDRGVGKTRLLEEVTHLLKMRGKAVYYTEIVEHDNTNLKPIANILRQTIKNASRDILEKYGRELVKILPELKFLLGIESFSDIGGDRERLRLYDRITNYLEEVSKDKPIYLIFDNIENCNTQLLFLLDYIINNINKGTIILIISFNEKIIPTESTKINILESWADREDVEEIVVPNLDLSEIGEFIQHILGISYRPLKFSAVMLKESQGNPRYIEYMMKELYATGDLFLHPEGVWEIKTQKYSDIYFPSNMDEVLKSQLNLIKKEDMDIMKVVSIYDDPMPKNILLKIMDIDKDNLNKKLDTLISMRLLDERVGDWGYSYSISNVQLKKLIYHQIPQDERVKIHKQVAQLLEKVYEENYNLILDELIYHLMSSSQPVKALDYIVKEARKCVNIFSSKSVVLWEEAYEITKNIKSKYKFEILENLGKIYSMKGYNNKALKIYRELFEEGKRLGKIDYIVIAYIGIGEICFKKNLIDMSLKKAQEAIKTSKDAGYLDGIAESQLLYNRILLNERRLEEVEKNIGELLEFILKNKLKKYFGSIYNIIGLVEYYKGNIENAISWYKESIVYFHAVEEFIDSTKPMNNIANIYCQYGDYSKAME
jgi:serine/threonine protein kinase